MGLLVNEEVILEYKGYLVIEMSVDNKFHSYVVAEGIKDKYKFVFHRIGDKLGGAAFFQDLISCEAFFSGLVSNKELERRLSESEATTVGASFIPIMNEVHQLFKQLKTNQIKPNTVMLNIKRDSFMHVIAALKASPNKNDSFIVIDQILSDTENKQFLSQLSENEKKQIYDVHTSLAETLNAKSVVLKKSNLKNRISF